MRIVAVSTGFACVRAFTHFDFVRVAMTFLAQLSRRFNRFVRIVHRIECGNECVQPRDFFTHDFFLRPVALRTLDIFPLVLRNRFGRLDRKLARLARCWNFIRRSGQPIGRRVTARARIIFVAFENVRVGVLARLPQRFDVVRLTGGN